jgi:predicted glycosyltransferase involved in capsule biosynthesis
MGAHCTSSRYLFFLDCDIVLKSDVLNESLPVLNAGNCFVVLSRVHETEPILSGLFWREDKIETLTLRDGRRAVVQQFTANDGTRSGSGLLLVSKENFLAVHGFNSQLVGWGFEDLDFQIRLQLVTNITCRKIGEAIHLTHAPDGLTGASRAEDRQNNLRKCLKNYRNGSLMGTFLEDRQKWIPK